MMMYILGVVCAIVIMSVRLSLPHTIMCTVLHHLSSVMFAHLIVFSHQNCR